MDDNGTAAILTAMNNKGKVVTYAAIGLGVLICVVLLYFFVYKPYKKEQVEVTNDNYDEATAAGQANSIADKIAIATHRVGTDEKALYEAADEIANGLATFNQVAEAYRRKYKDTLTERLKKELNSKEFAEFERRRKKG